MRGPSPEAQKQLIAQPIDLGSGERLTGRNPNAFIEYYRADQSGRIAEAPEHLTSRFGGYNGPDSGNPLSALFNFFDRGPFVSGPSGGPRDSIRPPAAVPNAGPSYRGPRIEFLDRLFR